MNEANTVSLAEHRERAAHIASTVHEHGLTVAHICVQHAASAIAEAFEDTSDLDRRLTSLTYAYFELGQAFYAANNPERAPVYLTACLLSVEDSLRALRSAIIREIYEHVAPTSAESNT